MARRGAGARLVSADPVKRGLVAEPEHWEGSSYRSHAFGEAHGEDQSVACSGDEDSDCGLAARVRGREHRIPTLCEKRKGGPPNGCDESEETQGPSTAFGYASLRSG